MAVDVDSIASLSPREGRASRVITNPNPVPATQREPHVNKPEYVEFYMYVRRL